ncbi:MAG: hypothetical protein F6K48_21450 [Okeania sp. SIO3H1]|nr:hypothetical protein [Okeania sp. SIO3H1]
MGKSRRQETGDRRNGNLEKVGAKFCPKYHVRLNTYNICGPKAEGRRERVRLEGRRFFITDYPNMI